MSSFKREYKQLSPQQQIEGRKRAIAYYIKRNRRITFTIISVSVIVFSVIMYLIDRYII